MVKRPQQVQPQAPHHEKRGRGSGSLRSTQLIQPGGHDFRSKVRRWAPRVHRAVRRRRSAARTNGRQNACRPAQRYLRLSRHSELRAYAQNGDHQEMEPIRRPRNIQSGVGAASPLRICWKARNSPKDEFCGSSRNSKIQNLN